MMFTDIDRSTVQYSTVYNDVILLMNSITRIVGVVTGWAYFDWYSLILWILLFALLLY